MKILRRILLILLIVVIAAFFWLNANIFPPISGYGSKNLCSAIYLQHREASRVIQEEFSTFPLSLGKFTHDPEDSSTYGSVLGFAGRKTIYRKGCGCTIVNDITEEELRAQKFDIPKPEHGDMEQIPWPVGELIADSIPSHIDTGALSEVMDKVMSITKEDGVTKSTLASLVIYDGQIVAERYTEGFDKNTVMLGWSISKSLIAAMIGALEYQQLIDIYEPAPVPEWKGTEKERITIRHLLQQTSGLDYTEIYDKPSSVVQMLFSEGDMVAYTAGLDLIYEPGAVYNYSGGNTNILSRIIRHTVGEDEYQAFPFEQFFHRINAYSFILEPDASGTYVGSSYSYATARDFARFGLLLYNNGVWEGERILPENWVEEATTPVPADPREHYGYQLWLNGYSDSTKSSRWYPDVSEDMFFADGYNGQDIFVIPSKKLVVVRLGLQVMDENAFLRGVIQTVQDGVD